jgi:hypothetical protein
MPFISGRFSVPETIDAIALSRKNEKRGDIVVSALLIDGSTHQADRHGEKKAGQWP